LCLSSVELSGPLGPPPGPSRPPDASRRPSPLAPSALCLSSVELSGPLGPPPGPSRPPDASRRPSPLAPSSPRVTLGAADARRGGWGTEGAADVRPSPRRRRSVAPARRGGPDEKGARRPRLRSHGDERDVVPSGGISPAGRPRTDALPPMLRLGRLHAGPD